MGLAVLKLAAVGSLCDNVLNLSW